MSQPKNPTPRAPERAPKQAVGDEGKKPLVDDDVLHVPRGVSRGTFIFLVCLIVFLLVIWMGGDALFGISDQGPRNPVAVRFQVPSGRTVEWRANDVVMQHRATMDALQIDVFLGSQLGIDVRRPEPPELTRVLVLDRIAEDAGVEVTDEDLRAHIGGILQWQRATPEDWMKGVRASGLDVRTVEETLRRLLRVQRFQQLVGYAGAVPDPARIEEQWHQENEEFAFDYVVASAANLREDARKELPDDAALEAWFQALPEGEQAEFRTPEKRAAELALFRDVESTPAAELLAAYPEQVPEGTEPTAPDELATRYYNRVYAKRFAKPAEEGADPMVPAGFFPQEEVQEACLAEAPVYFALQRWIEDLEARKTNGETIDLMAEAQRLGLDHQGYVEPRTRDDYVTDTALRDAELASAIFDTPADGSFHASPLALRQGLCVVRTNSRVEPALPPFAEIRDRVAEKWIEPKSRELARARLAALRDSFESFVPEPEEGEEAPPASEPKRRASADAFRAAAEAAGLAVQHRDYLNKAGPASKDPQETDADHRALFQQARAWQLYELAEDEVAEPGATRDETSFYLVRLAAKRPVPIDEMSPVQYDRYKQNTRNRAIAEIGQELDLDFLRKNYGLWLYEDDASIASSDPQ